VDRKTHSAAVVARSIPLGDNNTCTQTALYIHATPLQHHISTMLMLLDMCCHYYSYNNTHSLNVAYNYSNKKALNMIKAPLTLSALQMLVGVAYVLPLWLFKLRAAPSMSRDNLKTLLPIGSCHAASHLAAVIGLGAGSVSFTHIVKVNCCLVYCCATVA
jgi:Triose-phosphate Transporter family